MSDDAIAFIFNALREMNFYLDEADAGSKFGPAGIDLDSLAVIELASRIEDSYGVTLTEEDMEAMAFATVGEFAAEVARRSRSAVPLDSSLK